MWKVSGKKIFPRWQKIRQTAAKCRNPKPKGGKSAALCVVSEESHSSGNSGWKQHARKQHSFWDDPLFHNQALCNTLLETLGLVGTAAFCLDLQQRHCRNAVVSGNGNPCIFSRLAFAMPFSIKKRDSQQGATAIEPVSGVSECCEAEKKHQQHERDVDAAAREVRSSAMSSLAAMENSMGLVFLKQDEEQAFEFFKASAGLDCPKGLFNLGLCYETGRGTSIDLKKAACCYARAAAKDHGLAIYNLAVYTLKGLGGVPQDFKKGLELLKQAASRGVAKAQVSLGVYYLDEELFDEAYKMFRASIDNNSIDGKYYLGLCYENGWGVERNEAIAAEMFAQAARKGHDEATLKLGLYFESNDFGMDPDTEFSMTLYQMLADKGHKGGKHAMDALEKKEKARWKLKDNFSKPEEQSQQVLKKPEPALHTSTSVPELRNYASYCKIGHTVSALHPVLSLNDLYVGLQNDECTNNSFIKHGVDFVDKSPLQSHLAAPHTVMASS